MKYKKFYLKSWLRALIVKMTLILFIFQQSEIGLWVTGLYLVLVQPVLLLYKSLETRPQQQLYSVGRQQEEEEEEVKERSNV